MPRLIAREMGTRTAAQVRSHLQKYRLQLKRAAGGAHVEKVAGGAVEEADREDGEGEEEEAAGEGDGVAEDAR